MIRKFTFPLALSILIYSCSGVPNTDQGADTNAQVALHKEAEENWPERFGFGKEASSELIERRDIDISPDGKGLPAGSGTVALGRSVYLSKCVACHGTRTSNGSYDRLFAIDASKVHPDSVAKGKRTKTIGNYWPYATTLYDYINRAMPFNSPGSLQPADVYSLTAYLLYENGIVKEDVVLTSTSLPRIIMPARRRFVEDDRRGGAEVK